MSIPVDNISKMLAGACELGRDGGTSFTVFNNPRLKPPMVLQMESRGGKGNRKKRKGIPQTASTAKAKMAKKR